MATKPALKVTISGPIKNPKKALKKGRDEVLKSVGKAMVEDVQKQLYPSHGYLTGRLRRSVIWRKGRTFKNNKAELVVDTSRGTPNKNVPYTRWIEESGRHPRWGTMTRFRGYHMFRKTATKFVKQKRVDGIVMRGMVGKLNK